MEPLDTFISAQRELLPFYSPYHFVRSISSEIHLQSILLPEIHKLEQTSYRVTIEGEEHLFLFEYLPWDSSYFALETIKLRMVLYTHRQESILTEAIRAFIRFASASYTYCFAEIPSEDILLIQCLGMAQFKLVETRLTYFNDQVASFHAPRYEVRRATASDATNLMRVAREMRNDYDRFHADAIFDEHIADEFLATYIEQSLNGFADVVLTPAEPHTPSDSFLTARFLKKDWTVLGIPVSKMVLSAVSAQTNKGWYKKLISEMTYLLKDEGATTIFMNTQSTNRAVIHTWENLGYHFGCATHIFSYNFSAK